MVEHQRRKVNAQCRRGLVQEALGELRRLARRAQPGDLFACTVCAETHLAVVMDLQPAAEGSAGAAARQGTVSFKVHDVGRGGERGGGGGAECGHVLCLASTGRLLVLSALLLP